jgi:hypothetical protein
MINNLSTPPATNRYPREILSEASLSTHCENLQSRATEGADKITQDSGEGRYIHWLSPASLKILLNNIHPACLCFEPQEADVLRLAESLEQTGPRQPIELLGDKLLDGHSRVKAALRLGISLPAVVITKEDLNGLSPFQYALRNNRAAACGRSLNDLQIALVATRFDNEWFSAAQAAARQRQENGGKAKDDDKGSVYELAAKKYQVSTHCLKIANAVIACNNEAIYGYAYAGHFSLAAIRRIVKRPESEWAQALVGEMVAASQPKKRRRGTKNQTTVEISQSPKAVQLRSLQNDFEDSLQLTQVLLDALAQLKALLATQDKLASALPTFTLAAQHVEHFSGVLLALISSHNLDLGDI